MMHPAAAPWPYSVGAGSETGDRRQETEDCQRSLSPGLLVSRLLSRLGTRPPLLVDPRAARAERRTPGGLAAPAPCAATRCCRPRWCQYAEMSRAVAR